MVRISDTLKQQNDLTSFPVAFGDSIWLNKDKTGATENYSDLQTMYNNDELGNGGSSIQVDTMPIASVDELGKIYEFIGSTGTYVNGYFYECVSDEQNPPTYSWVQKNVQPNSVTLTQQEYEALSEEQKLDGLYYTYDTKRIYKNGVQYGASDAEGIGYNNSGSGIQATTVQGAIDKVVKKVDEVKIELTEYVDNKTMYVSDESDTYIAMEKGHHCTMYFTIYGNTMTIFAIQRASNDGRTIQIKYPLPFKELPTIKITYGTPAGKEVTTKNTLTEWAYDQNYGDSKQNEMHFMIQGKI